MPTDRQNKIIRRLRAASRRKDAALIVAYEALCDGSAAERASAGSMILEALGPDARQSLNTGKPTRKEDRS